MKIKVKMNSASQIIKRLGVDAQGKATIFLRDEVARHCDKYVPFKNGKLKNNISFPNSHSIKYNSPYARIHYHGKIMVDPKYKVGGFFDGKRWYSRTKVTKIISDRDFSYRGAPKRGSKWDKRMWNDKGKSICKDIEKFIKNGGK